MPKNRILVVAANGQDGFLATVLSLEQGAEVLALTRSRDSRLSSLESQNPDLVYKWSNDYIFKLDEYISVFLPTHVFYFASQHGPSGTMPATRESIELTELLTRKIPEVLINLAKSKNFGLTLPLSSRMYAGYTEGARGPVLVDLETLPKPNDFYGYGKLELLQISTRARSEGVYVNSPILFNHGSMFSKPGYVSHAIADEIASRISKNHPHSRVTNPNAPLDLSDAVRVVNFLLSMQEAANGLVLVSSGVTPKISQLIHEQSTVVAGWLDKPLVNLEDVPSVDLPVLTAPTSPLALSEDEISKNFSWLGGMALTKVLSGMGGASYSLPKEVMDTLPITFRALAPNLVFELIPKEIDETG